METVFISGSRKLGRLNAAIRERLDTIVDRGFRVVIGDASGSDRAVQSFLAERHHRNVLVHCMDSGCRNNVGAWPVHSVSGRGKRGFQYFALKDAEMAHEADYGLMIWDGKSRGTFSNILRMLDSGKPSVVYFALDKDFWTVKSRRDLEQLVRRCPLSDRERLSELLAGQQEQIALFSREEGPR